MARRKIKRSSLFTLVAVVALLSLGVAFAWSSELTINGTVETTDAKVVFTSAGAEKLAGHGDCDATKSSENLVTFDISDAAPGTKCEVSWTAKNVGGVPMDWVSSVNDLNTLAPGVAFADLTCSVTDGSQFFNVLVSPLATLAVEGEVTCSGVYTVTSDAEPNSNYGITNKATWEVSS